MDLCWSRRRLLALAAQAGVACAAPAAALGVPRRIVALEWASAETLVALGAPPVATASPYRMHAGGAAAMGLPGVMETGALFEPNIEVIQAARPDLIFCGSWQQGLVPILERIAPTRVFNLRAPTRDILANAVLSVEETGERLDRAAEAVAYVKATQARFERLREALVPHAAQPLLIGTLEPDGRHVTIYSRGSLFHDILRRLGLSNGWDGAVNGWGSAIHGIETLALYPEATFFYLDTGPRAEAALRLLAPSTLWNALPAVRRGRVRALPYAWAFGGLPTALDFAEGLAASLLSEPLRDGRA